MELVLDAGDLATTKAGGLILFFFQGEKLPKAYAGVDAASGKLLSRVLATKDFKGREGQLDVVYASDNLAAERVVFAGLGKQAEFNGNVFRKVLAGAVGVLREKGVAAAIVGVRPLPRLVPDRLGMLLAEGATLGGYTFDGYKSAPKEEDERRKRIEQVNVLAPDQATAKRLRRGFERGRIIAESQNLVRDLSNQPANELPPKALAEVARKVAKDFGIKCTVLGRDEMKKQGFGGVLGVSQGSAQEPQFIVLEYLKGKGKPAVFAGKAITFDTGGISLKPALDMDQMKHDMSGGAAVIGALRAIAALKLKVNVVGLVSAAENMPGGQAMRPGDVIKALNGKTIEVLNTDAEGRLVLSDAISYAKRYDPRAVIDLATLTGACVVALGFEVAGLFGNNAALSGTLRKLGEETGERLWPMPLWKEHDKLLESPIADIKNIAGREGGAITGAAFIKAFVDGFPWCHLDIAGTAWTNESKHHQQKGGTGFGVRLLVEYARRLAA